MGKIIGFVSIKGGVGKTTVALEVASSLANDFEQRVLLVDANFSAPNVHLYLDLTQPEFTLHDALLGIGLHNAIREKHGFDFVPASISYKHDVDFFRLKKVLAKFKRRYDFIILDSAPNYQELIPVVAACDSIFVVTTPDDVTLMTSMRAAGLSRKKGTPIEGIVVNKIRNPKYELNLRDIEKISNIPVVAMIKDHGKVEEGAFFKTPVNVYNHNNSFSKEIRNFCSALAGLPEKLGFFHRLVGMGKESVNRELMRKDYYSSQLQ